MGDQGSSVGTKIISLRVPFDLNPEDITRVKAKKEDEIESQEIAFEIQGVSIDRGRSVASEALGRAPADDDASAPVSEQLLGQPPVNLADVWEWDWFTGDPIFKYSPNLWSRYVPEEFLNDVVSRSGITGNFSDHEKRVANRFVEGMRANKVNFQLEMGISGVKNIAQRAEEKLFSRVLYFDIKNFSFTRKSNGDYTLTFLFTKTNDPFLPYAELPEGEKTFKTYGVSSKALGELAMKNAKYGQAGPGSFWCRHPNCKLGALMSASEIVDFGGQQPIKSTKRFKCSTPNVIYALHCNVCTREGTCAIHIGSTGDIHDRMRVHFDPKQRHGVPSHQIYTPSEINTFITNGQDPGQFRRDSHVHFGDRRSEDLPGYEHPGIGRKAARITIIQQFSGTERRKAEQKAKNFYHSQQYFGHGRGGLNKYSAC